MTDYTVPSEGLTSLTAAELADKIHSREVTSREVVQAHLDRIEDTNGALNSFLHIGAEAALATADEVDQSLDAGDKPASRLAGVPLALKDLVNTTDAPTTAGSKMLEGWMSPYDATITTKIRKAGIPILGKTNTDEFAMGSSTENSAYGPTRNPYDLARTPGGSGGGTSAAVASGQAPLGIGTDTGGSIRQPAALTNIVGVKPTYGTVSRYGIIAAASSLDQAGPTGRTVLDTALLHEVIAGEDPFDATSVHTPIPDVVAAAQEGATGDLSGVTVGLIKQMDREGWQDGVLERYHETVEQMKSQGAKIIEVDCLSFEEALAAYYVIMPSEVSSNLARFDGMRYGKRVGDDGTRGVDEVMSMSRAAGFGPEVKRRIMLGTYALSVGYFDAYYLQAQRVRQLVARDFRNAFQQADVVVSPTSPTTAFKLGTFRDDPTGMYSSDLCTLPLNLAGIAGMSVPAGFAKEDNMPVGFQIMAPAFEDDRLYRVGAAVEAGRK